MASSDADEATLAADAEDGEAEGDAAEGDDATTGDQGIPRGGTRPVELPEVDRERYAVGEHVASGGGGRIHVAHDTWLGRTVAIKRIRPSRDPTARDRFVREALLTARLQHPGIVPVYEAGRWPDGDAFYAMKLVSGRPLSKELEGLRTLAERLALLPHVLDMAEAIAYAHSRGVIHRDLKPANVLVGSFGETVVIDWGLGKDLGDDVLSETPGPAAPAAASDEAEADADGELTRAGAVIGTPAYMPPEQARGEPVGPPADVYALGAILYHVLAGRPPYERGPALEVLGHVLLDPPTPLPELVPAVPRELAAIVAKAMAREPSERYPTAAQLAEDLRRYQTGQIVGAHRYTAGQRLRRWLWRHRTAVAASVTALLVLALGGVYRVVELQEQVKQTSRQYVAAETARWQGNVAQARAEAAQAQAVDRSDALLVERARVEVATQPSSALGCLAELSERFDRWPRAQVIAADAAARGLASVLRPCAADGAEACVEQGASALMRGPGRVDVLRGDGRIEGFDVLGRRSQGLLIPAEGVVLADRRGDVVVTLDAAGELSRWDVASQRREALARPVAPLSVVAVVGERDVVGLETAAGSARLWHWSADGAVRLVTTCDKQSEQLRPPVAIAPGGRWVGCMSAEGRLVLVEIGGERTLSRTLDSLPSDVAVTDDGRFVAWALADGPPVIWDVAADRTLTPEVGGDGRFSTTALRFVPGAARLVASDYGGAVATWTPGQAALTRFSPHEAMVGTLEVADDGRSVATAATDGTVHLYALPAGAVRRLEGAGALAMDVEVTADGSAVVVLSYDRSIHAWPIDSPHGQVVAALPEPAIAMAIDPKGERLAVGGRDGALWLVPVRGGAAPQRLEGLRGDVRSLAFSPDGATVAAGCEQGSVGVWTAAGERRWLEALAGGPIRGVSFSSRGDELAVAAYLRGVVRLAADSGRARATIAGERVVGVERLVDGGLLAWSHQGWVGVWAADGSERLRRQLADEVWVASASPRGDAIVVAGRDGRLRRYALPGGEETVAGRTGAVVHVEHVGGGDRLVTVSNDQRLRRWDATTLALERVFEGHRAHVGGVAVRRDGRRMASVGHDGRAIVWDLGTGESRALLGHDGAVAAAVLEPDGRAVITAGEDGTVRRWPDDVPDDEAGLRAWLEQQLARAQ